MKKQLKIRQTFWGIAGKRKGKKAFPKPKPEC